MAMDPLDPQQDGPAAPLSLAAARAMFRAPQASNVCWADVELPDGSVRACGRPEATSLGLCQEHRLELFGLGDPAAEPVGTRAPGDERLPRG